jgi:hypothetical protein
MGLAKLIDLTCCDSSSPGISRLGWNTSYRAADGLRETTPSMRAYTCGPLRSFFL